MSDGEAKSQVKVVAQLAANITRKYIVPSRNNRVSLDARDQFYGPVHI